MGLDGAFKEHLHAEFREMMEAERDRLYKEYSDPNGESTGHIPFLLLTMLKEGAAEPHRIAMCLAVPFNEDDEKRDTMRGIGIKMAKDDGEVLLAAVFTCESWLSNKSTEEGVRPTDASDCREALLLAGLTIDGERGMTAAGITRTDENYIRIGEFPEMIWNEGVHCGILRWIFEGNAVGHLSGRAVPEGRV